jgi:hypothetical protein
VQRVNQDGFDGKGFSRSCPIAPQNRDLNRTPLLGRVFEEKDFCGHPTFFTLSVKVAS